MSASLAAPQRRRAVVGVFVAVSIPVFLGLAALAVDLGHMFNVRADLQRAADAAALAVADQISSGLDGTELRELARTYAIKNHPGQGDILSAADFALGNWDADNDLFTPGGLPVNSVRVTMRRADSNGNPVSLFFASIFGVHDTGIIASATALAPGGEVRFLIDDEMFDTDVPVIEDLADSLGLTSDELLSDGDGDEFIDFPPGVIELPTGQVADEALFAIGPDFPFTPTSVPSLLDFLLFEEGVDQRGIFQSEMVPLLGVEPVSDPAEYPAFVNPNQILVSPVYKSDISDTEPGVNALGERRGLVAFKIIGVGADPDGPGSVLPGMIVEIVSPTTVDLAALVTAGGGSAWLVE